MSHPFITNIYNHWLYGTNLDVLLDEYMRIKHHWSCVRAVDFFFHVFFCKAGFSNEGEIGMAIKQKGYVTARTTGEWGGSWSWKAFEQKGVSSSDAEWRQTEDQVRIWEKMSQGAEMNATRESLPRAWTTHISNTHGKRLLPPHVWTRLLPLDAWTCSGLIPEHMCSHHTPEHACSCHMPEQASTWG